jgi:hypothetical protein
MTIKRVGEPHEPPLYDNSVIAAIRALSSGAASEAQQKTAWDWIVYQASGYFDLSYRPGEDGRRATDFMEGRRFVGAQMLKMLQPALTPAKPEPPVKKGKK